MIERADMLRPMAELLRLEGKAAIVTGGAQGIGFGIVCRLAEAGASVLVADLDEEAAVSAGTDLSGRGWRAEPFRVDVSDEDEVVAMTSACRSAFGTVDILVNNAGIFPNVPISEMSAGDFDRVVAVNLRGLFLCTKHASQVMIEQGDGGRIINITSIDALHPSMVGLAHYDASKHGAWGFTKNSALELAQHRIWVNAIAPGGVTTPGVEAMQAAAPSSEGIDPQQAVEAFPAKIPMRRMGEPDDIGKVALFLASDLASYLTGSQIVVDGGALLA